MFFDYTFKNWYWFIGSIGIVYGLWLMFQNPKTFLRGSNIQILGLLLTVFFLFYNGFRPTSCFEDTNLYTEMYRLVQRGIWNTIPIESKEWFWGWVELTCIKVMSDSGWLFVVSTFYTLGMCFAAWRWLPRHYTMAVIFMFTAFSFFGYANNGIRQGMASSMILAAMALLTPIDRKAVARNIIAIVLFILAISTHFSMAVAMMAAIVAFFFPSEKIPFYIWGICLILSPFTSEVFLSIGHFFTDDYRLDYYQQFEDVSIFSRTGWRWDFILYSSMPVLMGWWVIFKKKITTSSYTFLISCYLYTNSAWMLLNSVPYSNRFAYISWFMYPLLLAYPLGRFRIFKNQSLWAGAILILCVAFTIIVD